ncbi:type II toxin-antitoxin system VapB family antitoxin [Flexivirga meconopsidis]|uniref:type II toxin-antitoxin system VapB family antitoxin n=1 Tax=Flexivirga meconopsidis TaxID=2977121 RepID=UPI00223EA092|nr:type II toxin-antitoxin system VapB family antitoxin [Flexivirga meconopsidis]
MTRTNIEIDDALIGRVMQRHGFRTKREAVAAGLRALDPAPLNSSALLSLEGMGWSGDLDALRDPEMRDGE